VNEGVVRVSWQDGEALLRAGDSGWFPPGGDAETARNETAPEAAEAEEPKSEPDAPPAASRYGNVRQAYERHASNKAFKDAFDLLEKNPALAGTSARELMLAADVARGAGHMERAIDYLGRVLNEYSSDQRAPLAAFTLGRIHAGAGRQDAAANYFLKARSLAPSGPLAEYSLAREVESRALSGDLTHAQKLARQYLKLYPNGQRRAMVRQHAQLQ
jgi:tetratricopeptide (TPR) repeat protein